MKKRLILRWVFLVILLGYGIWRMRSANFPESTKDDSFFEIPLPAAIAKEDNLGYTLQSEKAQALMKLIASYDTENVGWKRFDRYYLSDFYKLKEVKVANLKLLPEETRARVEENIEHTLQIWSRYDLDLDEFFSRMQMQELLQKVEKNWYLLELISKINTQEWVIDSYGRFEGANAQTDSKKISTFLTILGVYYYHTAEPEKGQEALTAALLLNLKQAKFNNSIETAVVFSKMSKTLEAIHYLKEKNLIPEEHLQTLSSFLDAYHQDPMLLSQHMLKLDYQGHKKMVLMIPSRTGEESWKGKTPLFHLNETLAWLKSFYELASTVESTNYALFEERKHKLDARCLWETGMSKENEHYLIYHYRISLWEPLVSALWRKNAVGTQILCSLYPRTDVSYYENIYQLKDQIFWEE